MLFFLPKKCEELSHWARAHETENIFEFDVLGILSMHEGSIAYNYFLLLYSSSTIVTTWYISVLLRRVYYTNFTLSDM